MAHAGEAQLLERELELATLSELVARATDDGGAVALVEGPAGIGKSSLIETAMAAARAAGCETALARASELERDFAFGLVRQLFEPMLAGFDAKRRAQLFAGAAGLSAPLFEPAAPEELAPRDEAAHAALHGLYWLTVNLAGIRPIALAVDDAHWGDAPSLRFLAYLVNRVADLPVFLIVGARPSEPGAEEELLDQLADSPATVLIRPQPLTRAAAKGLVRSALGEDPDDAFLAACTEATTGNPLFLHELLAALRAEGVTPTAAQAGHVLDVAPESVSRSVARRLRRLGPNTAEMARAISILGHAPELSTSASMAGLDQDSAAAAAEELTQAGILNPGTLEFVHPVVRAAVYSQLSPAQRARGHRTAAGILVDRGTDGDQVTLHLLAGEPRGDPWVAETLRRAARGAHSRGAPDIAATYLRRALKEPPPAAERPDILVELGSAELAAGIMSGFRRMREAWELADDPVARARMALRLGMAYSSWTAWSEAAEMFRAGLDELGGRDSELADQLEARLLATSIPEASLHSPDLEARLTSLLEKPSESSDPVLLTAMATLAVARQGPAAEGALLAERALATGELSMDDDPAIVGMAAVALMAADRLEEARKVCDDIVADARRRGSLFAVGLGATVRALVLVRTGAIPAAEADARNVLDDLSESARVLLPWVLCSVIEAHLERGELEVASRLLDEHGMAAELPDTFQMNYLLESVARLRIAQWRVDEGIAKLRECGRRMDAMGARNPALLAWRSSLAPALAGVGERDEARVLVAEDIELAREFGVSRELGMALRASALVEGGGAAVSLLREAVSVLETSSADLEHARALTDLGAAVRRGGHRSDAREPLRSGLDLARRCGATALATRAHAELVATGARPRRLVLTGVDALTASERRVAEMASEGLTNREIAQALFVTEKTVEGHLGHAYRKLDIRSRSQLHEALSRRDEPA